MTSNVRKVSLDGRIMDVVDYENYVPNSYPAPVAVQFRDNVYPERNREDSRPGVYSYKWQDTYASIIVPCDTTDEEYNAAKIIDFNSNSIQELIAKNQQLKDIERQMLTNIEDVYVPPFLDADTPETRGLKEAVVAKGCDIHAYEGRFGSGFNNDIRLFNKPSITLGKIRSICDNLDIKVTVRFEDKNPNVPNPMNCVIEKEITGGSNDE